MIKCIGCKNLLNKYVNSYLCPATGDLNHWLPPGTYLPSFQLCQQGFNESLSLGWWIFTDNLFPDFEKQNTDIVHIWCQTLEGGKSNILIWYIRFDEREEELDHDLQQSRCKKEISSSFWATTWLLRSLYLVGLFVCENECCVMLYIAQISKSRALPKQFPPP